MPELLSRYDGSTFRDSDHNYRWLSTDSENYRPDLDFEDGYVMEGGFFNGATNVALPIGYYQIGLSDLADSAARDYFVNVWLRMGPYETMRQWTDRPPGLYLETSIYIEPVISTIWLIKEMMGIRVDGSQVTIEPALGGEFMVTNLHISSKGEHAVVDYWRDFTGREFIQIHSNSGLTITAPGVVPVDEPTPTSAPPPTRTPAPTSQLVPTQTPILASSPTATASSFPSQSSPTQIPVLTPSPTEPASTSPFNGGSRIYVPLVKR
jgi:hypothetical protein